MFEILYNKVQSIYLKHKTRVYVTEKQSKENNQGEAKLEELDLNQELESEFVSANEEIWQIEIPKINLIAPIAEGTSQNIMLEFVGHFENTKIFEGNVGLAAHNRGYPINYFAKLKELEYGDEIIYYTKYGIKKYKVDFAIVIEETDWSFLQETEENIITLITCVENEASKRRCVRGIEVKEE